MEKFVNGQTAQLLAVTSYNYPVLVLNIEVFQIKFS